MGRGTTLRNVRIDDERWEGLLVVAEAEGSDRSQVIRDMIDVKLDAHGIAPPADSFLYPKDITPPPASE